MIYKNLPVVLLVFAAAFAGYAFLATSEVASYDVVAQSQPAVVLPPDSIAEEVEKFEALDESEEVFEDLPIIEPEIRTPKPVLTSVRTVSDTPYHNVPFYSQFADISQPQWQKVGCGIASVAMLIDFYSEETKSVDTLLQEGIDAGYFLSDAGWIHQGLINLTKQFGLNGSSVSLQHLAMESAFTELQTIVTEGPVMVSVHYTFQPTNPIPHLAVITGIDGGQVYYNDPADLESGNSISIEQFKSAWKKRYIVIRPAA